MIAAKHFLLAFGMFVILVASGCSGCSKQPRHAVLEWSEPVQLASGETVQIKRKVEMWHETAFGGGFSSAPVFKTNSIELDSATPEFPKWDSPLVPIVMDKDSLSGEWIVIASVNECGMWARNGSPLPPYWTFRLRNRVWYRDVLPEAFLGRAANLFVEYDTVDTSRNLREQVAERKLQQTQAPKHAQQYRKVDPNFTNFQGCAGDLPSNRGEQPELDLKKFERLS